MHQDQDIKPDGNNNSEKKPKPHNKKSKVPIDEEKWICPICADKLDNPVVTPCGHIFCFKCINRWLSSAKTCPMCAQRIESKEDLIFIPGHGERNINFHSVVHDDRTKKIQQFAFLILIIILLVFVI